MKFPDFTGCFCILYLLGFEIFTRNQKMRIFLHFIVIERPMTNTNTSSSVCVYIQSFAPQQNIDKKQNQVLNRSFPICPQNDHLDRASLTHSHVSDNPRNRQISNCRHPGYKRDSAFFYVIVTISNSDLNLQQRCCHSVICLYGFLIPVGHS